MALKPAPAGFAAPVPMPSPDAVLMERRVEILTRSFWDASKACGIEFAADDSVAQKAAGIVKAAKEAKLDPQIYRLIWFVKKTANGFSST